MSKVDSNALKSGYFNFAGSSHVEYSMTSGFFVNGNKSVKTQNNNIESDFQGDIKEDSLFKSRGKGRNTSRSFKRLGSRASQRRRTISRNKNRRKSNFKRYETCAPKLKKGFEDIEENELDRSKESYLYEEENISDCEHDNPAGVLIELYK